MSSEHKSNFDASQRQLFAHDGSGESVFRSENSAGARLRQARLAHGLSIKDVAKESCVSCRFLEALEHDNFSELPALTYTIGFARAYATVVGENPDEVIALLKSKMDGDYARQPAPVNEQPAASKRKLPAWLLPVGALFGVTLVVGAVGGTVPFGSFGPDSAATPLLTQADTADQIVETAQGDDLANRALQTQVKQTLDAKLTAKVMDASQEVPVATFADADVKTIAADGVSVATAPERETDTEVQPDTKQEMQATMPSISLSKAAFADDEAMPEGQDTVTFLATRDSWVRIARQDGTEIWSGVLEAGGKFSPTYESGMLVSMSDAGSVSVSLAEHRSVPFGERGQVLIDVPVETLSN